MVTLPRKPSIVAVLASRLDFDEISNIGGKHFDLCELRIDLLHPFSADLEALVEKVPFRKIATVRSPDEGGANAIPEMTRLQLLERWLPWCDLIDVELKSLNRFSRLVQHAESAGKEVIVSMHDFVKTPALEELQEMLDRCCLRSTQIFKVATNVARWSDVETLIHLVQRNPESRVAAMGMGEFGKLSRLVLPRLGSCLVYGTVGEALVPGQWTVMELAQLLSEI